MVAPPAIAGGATALSSARTTYRSLGDYSAEIAALAAAHPGRVRRVVIGSSVQGRPLEGLEIAANVGRTDDGRPVHVELGLTHGREWPSGEVVMNFASELATGTGRRLRSLRARTRTFLFPVINPDGFALSRSALPDQRKNAAGVDINRNFGAFWGGPGSSDDPLSNTYRGPQPFSEPEAQAIRAWSSAHQVMVVNSNHTFGGSVLHQPGFARVDEPGLPEGSRLPGTGRFAALGGRMARAAGYVSEPAHRLYDVTGAAEDWNYFNQFSLAFTTEIGHREYHGPYRQAVLEQYLAGEDGVGVRGAMLLAGEAAADPGGHAVLRGRAPAGQTLRLARSIRSSTSYVVSGTDGPAPSTGPARTLRERLTSSMTVPEGGRFTWHVNPSTRPLAMLAGRTERWTLSCGDERRRVAIGVGRVRTVDLHC